MVQSLRTAQVFRIRNAENPLDSSAVHPESYHIVEQMAADLGCDIKELITNEVKRKKINPERYNVSNRPAYYKGYLK